MIPRENILDRNSTVIKLTCIVLQHTVYDVEGARITGLPFLCIPNQCNPPHKHARNMHCFIQLAMAVRFVAWLTHVENDQTWTVLMLINSTRADKLTWWSNENDNFGVGFPGLVMQPSKRVCSCTKKNKMIATLFDHATLYSDLPAFSWQKVGVFIFCFVFSHNKL